MTRPALRSDAELFAATPESPAAFGEFYRRHERAVLKFFLYWSRSGELAADLTAETFAAVFESLPRYQPDRGEPRAWLFGIAQNILARSVRRGRVEDETRRRLGLARQHGTGDGAELPAITQQTVRGDTFSDSPAGYVNISCRGVYRLSISVLNGHRPYPPFGSATFTVR